jgi:hypothetical protein
MALEEGRDVTPVVDPAVGRAPWPGSYDLWHQPPAVAALPGGALRDGDVVLASYYHAVTIYGSQVTASLTEPAVYDVVRGQLESTRREFAAAAAFAGWMLDYDEIRVHGWDESPRFGAGTPGDDLAQSVRAVHDMARALDPSADLYTWSDMFDPHHNAAQRAEPYYLVNGGWAGSWEGLPVDVGVINWNHDPEHRRDSARFFAERGHRQLLAGYYDTPPERFDDRAWLSDLEGIPGIDGVVYCQWGTGYGQLEAWATHVWGDAQWVPGPEPEATATATGSSQPNPTTAPTSATAASSVTPAASVTHTPRAAPSHRACLPVGWR